MRVSDSRPQQRQGDRRYRRRLCKNCGNTFTTTEVIGRITGSLSALPLLPQMVEKKNGKIERFERNKLMQSITLSVRKSQRDDVPISEIVEHIESEVALAPNEPVKTTTIGKQVLQALHRHDRLAYVRYLSVHQPMETTDEIRTLIDELQALLDDGNSDDR